MDGEIPVFTITPLFTKTFPISSLQALGLSEDISLLSNRQFLWSSLIVLRSSLMQIAPGIMYMQNGTLCKYLTKFIWASKKHKKNLS